MIFAETEINNNIEMRGWVGLPGSEDTVRYLDEKILY